MPLKKSMRMARLQVDPSLESSASVESVRQAFESIRKVAIREK